MAEYQDTNLESDSNIRPTTVRPGSHPGSTDKSAPPVTSGSNDGSKGASIEAPLPQRRQK
jgi:hypothetical protein